MTNKQDTIVSRYSILTGIEKSIFKMITVGGPLMLSILPEQWMNITLGTVIAFLINYEKNRNKEEVQDTPS